MHNYTFKWYKVLKHIYLYLLGINIVNSLTLSPLKSCFLIRVVSVNGKNCIESLFFSTLSWTI